jgi:hypothetical protein
VVRSIPFSEKLTNLSYYRQASFIFLRIIAPRKDTKKLDASGDDSNPNAYVLSDTTPQVTDTIMS